MVVAKWSYHYICQLFVLLELLFHLGDGAGVGKGRTVAGMCTECVFVQHVD